MITRYFPTDALTKVVASLADERRVLIPVTQPAVKNSVIFAPFTQGMTVELHKATVAPKEAVLPQCETLLTYSKTKDAADPTKVSLVLDDSIQAQPTVVFGCRPCDARGFAVLDRPYLDGPFVDPYYKAHREQLVVITQTCPSIGTTCFCHWVGSGPNNSTGSDIMLTAIEGGYVMEAVSEKGAALLTAMPLEDGSAFVPQMQAARNAVQALLAPAPDLTQAQEKIAARFSDETFWTEQTAHCLSCGACTYMCPTCYCFTITDEGDGCNKQGRRLRTWDTCMSPLFTREASGHNARMSKAQRMKNRISHKFSTYPENWGGEFSCNGCGRCIYNCPVNLDIRAIVLAAINDQGA